jgi:hypothetical protein
MRCRTGTWAIPLACALAVAGCKPGEEAEPDGAAEAPVERDDEPPAEVRAEAEREERCKGGDARREARERKRVASLSEPWLAARRHAVLVAHIDEVRVVLREGDGDDLERIVADTYARMQTIMPEANETHLVLLEAVTGVRAHGYATCRSVTDDDIGWCEGLDEDLAGGPASCEVMYTLYRTIVAHAVREGMGCEEALEDVPEVAGVDAQAWRGICEAVAAIDPATCPPPDDMAGVMCHVALDRRGEDLCETYRPEEERWSDCCARYRWRLSQVLNGSLDPRLSPETGALSGERSGCDRALAWGLFRDLAAMFGVEGAPPPLTDEYGIQEYTCSYVLHWTVQPLPGKVTVSAPLAP